MVVNAAGLLLGHLLPSFATGGRAFQLQAALGVETLLLEWEDSATQIIDPPELMEVLERMKVTLRSGRSVLVHCAQGRSRSSTVVIAYLVATSGMPVDEALRFVQARRDMAQPNANFLRQLEAMETALRGPPQALTSGSEPSDA
jgi:protein-tyrosine phosphatase